MPQPLTIWCNAKFPSAVMEQILRGIAPHRLIEAAASSATNLDAGNADPLLEQADVAFGQPDPSQVMRLPRLRWVQLTTAGYTRYDTPAFREAVKRNGTIICNSSSVYAEPCAQHLLAMMLAMVRRLPQSQDNQRESRGWPYLATRSQSKLLNGQTVLLVGYGAIGRRVAQLLAPFEMNVVGFRRTVGQTNEPAKIVSIEELDSWLPKADHVINTLPASAETESFFNADRFARMKRDAFYYNLGRGSTNDEGALQKTLENGHIGGAYIDAFVEEPLPPSHPLWTTPRCFVTPHTAGGHETEQKRHAELFLENLRRLQTGDVLIDRVM
jgi:phosphoglycerate dehydrogenase-like enzyme